jgi:hypothetical protein
VRPLASVWTVGDYPGRHTEVRIKQDFTSVPESSWLRRKLHRKVQQTHTPPHLGHGGLGVRPLASVWTFGDHPSRHTEVRIKHDFTSVPESSWLWRKLHQKVQLFQREGGGMVYWPACWVAYKRKSRRHQSSVNSQ